MASSFHSRFEIGALPAEAQDAFRAALRLAAEKAGQVWITDSGEVTAALVLTERLADLAAAEAERAR